MWRLIATEAAPRDRLVIMLEPYEPAVCLARWDEDRGRWWPNRGYSFWKHPTHWMPFDVPV